MKISESNLLSNFTDDIESGFENLRVILGLEKRYNDDAEKNYSIAYNSLKENYIYHIVRDQSMSRAEKLRKIRAFAPDYGNVDYIKSIIMILKEKVSARLR